MNITTIAKIKMIAEMAHEDCALTTLKNAKEQITNRSKIFAGYESQWQNVDRAEVLEAFELIMDCRTKAEFTRRCELLIESMIGLEIEIERAGWAKADAEREATAAAIAAGTQEAPAREEITFTPFNAETFINPFEAVAAAELKAEAIRIANRDFGYWITGEQVDAVLADNIERTAEQVARECVNAIKDAERRAALADTLAAAQTAYNAAQLATVEALNTACAASTDGTEDTPEFEQYVKSEEAADNAAVILLQACARYAVEFARLAGAAVSDIEALKTMYAPFFSGNFDNVPAGKRNMLIAKALQLAPVQLRAA